MPISYNEARLILEKLTNTFAAATEIVAIQDAVGRLNAHDCISAVSTPQHDTSAMDGYAVRSEETKSASSEAPLWFRVDGVVAAGETAMNFTKEKSICVEIMTGAQFPAGFDAVVVVENTTRIRNMIEIRQPVQKDQHRRFAGGDFAKGDKILSRGSVIKSRHIMAMASVGITSITVFKIRAGIWSTGLEIINGMIPDANGPYLMAALRETGVSAEFLGVLPDSPDALVRAIKGVDYDILLTTGAVSAGKYDFVRTSMEILGADIHFHHVAMRPGHPILCASVGKTVFFGLPGNPVATAACFQFLVVPFIVGPVQPTLVHARGASGRSSVDVFKHGKLLETTAEVNQQQGPAKMKPFSQSDCWIHLGRDIRVSENTSYYLL